MLDAESIWEKYKVNASKSDLLALIMEHILHQEVLKSYLKEYFGRIERISDPRAEPMQATLGNNSSNLPPDNFHFYNLTDVRKQ